MSLKTKENMKLIKVHDVETKTCEQVAAIAYTDDEGQDGVLIIAWHNTEEDGFALQEDFIEMDLDLTRSFLKGFEFEDAVKFVEKFDY